MHCRVRCARMVLSFVTLLHPGSPLPKKRRKGKTRSRTNGHEEIGPGEGETQDRNHGRTWEGKEEPIPKLPRREKSEEVQISTQKRDGQDPGIINDSWNTSAGRDSGHGKAWRVDVRIVKAATGLWRDEEPSGQPSSKRTAPTGEPESHPRRNLPQQRRAESITRRAGGEEMKNSDPQEMLGNTQEVNRMEAKRKESFSNSRFSRMTT